MNEEMTIVLLENIKFDWKELKGCYYNSLNEANLLILQGKVMALASVTRSAGIEHEALKINSEIKSQFNDWGNVRNTYYGSEALSGKLP